MKIFSIFVKNNIMENYKKSIEDRMYSVEKHVNLLKNVRKDKPHLLNSECTIERNAIFFDNNIKEFRNILEYSVPCSELTEKEITYDHPFGMSNSVRLIVRYNIDEYWKNDVEKFKTIMTSLNLTIRMPKSLNNKKSFKNWQFDINKNINDCINWNVKFKKEGIFFLEKDGKLFPIDDVYNEWRKGFDLIFGEYLNK